MADVSAVCLGSNGKIMTFGSDGKQMSEFSGPYSAELEAKIKAASDADTAWHAWDGSAPCDFDTLKVKFA